MLIISGFRTIRNGKKVRLRILQGRPHARMDWQQVGAGRSREDKGERAGTFQRTLPKYSVCIGEGAGAGAQAAHGRRHHQPPAVSRRSAPRGIHGLGVWQHSASPCRSPDKLGAKQLRPDYGKQVEGDGKVNIPVYTFA